METIIQTEGVTKHYGKIAAVDEVSLKVRKGEIYGFLGLNGAGKTTLIRILLGMVKADQGQVKLFGQDVNPGFTLWNEVGYLVETPSAYPNLTVRENLKVCEQLRCMQKSSDIDRIIEELKLDRYENLQARHLSLGNKQRLGLAKALMHRPPLLLLDEPINGLDPAGIAEVRELLKTLANEGATIFLSSHILGEISKIAHKIGIIHNGQLIKELTRQELMAQLITKVLVHTRDNTESLKVLKSHYSDTSINRENELEIHNPKAISQPDKISQILTDAGFPPKKILVFTEDLEMYFLRILKDA